MSCVPRLSALVILLAAATTICAQTSGDLFVSLSARAPEIGAVSRVPVGTTITFEVHAGWFGPPVKGATFEIAVPGLFGGFTLASAEGVTCSGAQPVRCEITSSKSNFLAIVYVVATLQSAGTSRATAKISAPVSDPNPGNDGARYDVEVVDRPSISLTSGLLDRLDPGQSTNVNAVLFNGGATATNVRLTVTVLEGGSFVSATVARGDVICDVTANEVVCTAAQLGFLKALEINISFTASPSLDGGAVHVHALVSANENDLDPRDNESDLRSLIVRHILVTNANDEGAGSLRQALLDARVLCDTGPCAIDFRIAPPVPAGGWFTIRPRTPLPEVSQALRIDGATQTAFSGNTNADGPEIEINGSLLDEGDGLVLRGPCGFSVRNLVINGFPRHAIEVHVEPDQTCPNPGLGEPLFISRNYLGTDARGVAAVPNERGVVMSAGFEIFILDNLISGNRRAGIFLGAGHYADVSGNRIGVNAKGEPLGNGASGIFLNVGDDEKPTFNSGADVDRNVIAYNGQWGLCRTSRGEIAVRGNSIFGNVSAGIDIGLDNDTPNRDDDTHSTPNKPVLFSAAYDPAKNATIVRGRIDSNVRVSAGSLSIEFFASSSKSVWGYSQGERSIGAITASNANFEFAAPGDWRGYFITATNTRTHFTGFSKPPLEQTHGFLLPADTSEFSNAVEAH